MKLLHFVFAGCLMATACRADEFFLRDAKGKQYGPFEATAGATIKVAGQDFEVVKSTTNRDAVLRAMDRIIIPEIEFRDASMSDVVAFLNKAAKENDPEKKGVEIALAVAPYAANIGSGVTNIEPCPPPTTFTARYISLCSALKIVTSIAGLKYRVDDGQVIIEAGDEPDGEILHRIYGCEWTFGPCHLGEPGRGLTTEPDPDQDARDIFMGMGVPFPRGASAVYKPSLHALVVANTASGLQTLEKLLRELNVVPKQIEIEAQFVRFELTELARLAPGHADAKTLLGLWTNGCGRVLAAPRVMTRSGSEASIRGVTEVIYPTTFYSNGDGSNAATATEQAIIPCDFQTREAGAILTVLPEVSPDGNQINLTITPNFVDLPTWRDYGWDVPTLPGQTRHIPEEQPYFHSFSDNTQVSMSDGATLLVGGGVPTQDGKGRVYCFVTAHFISTEGRELAVAQDDDKRPVPSTNSPAREAVIRVLHRIVLPQVEFNQTTINDVAAFLTKASRENDPEKQGVNVAWVAPMTGSTPSNGSTAVTTVTLSNQNVRLYSLVKTLRHATGLKVCVDGAGVRFMAQDEPESDIVVRMYCVEPVFIQRCTITTNGVELGGQAAGTGDLKSIFAGMGVAWPRGSSITYNSAVGKVIVANTAENQVRVEHLLQELNCVPKQVEIEVQTVQFDATNLAHLARGSVDAKALIALWTNGCGRVLAAPRVVTRSGSEASIRGVTEVIYPTIDDQTCCGSSNTNAVAVTEGGEFPSDFQTREVGAIFTVLPEVSPDGGQINLTMTPSFVDPPTWRDFGQGTRPGIVGTRYVPAELPVFHTVTFNTQVSLADGATVLLGGGVPTQDGKALVYLFVTARLIGMDGEPIRKPDQPVPVDLCEF